MRTIRMRHRDSISRVLDRGFAISGGVLVRTRDTHSAGSDCGCKACAHRHGAANMDAVRKTAVARSAARDAAMAAKIAAINAANEKHWGLSK